MAPNKATRISDDTIILGLLKLYVMLPNVSNETFLSQARQFFPNVKVCRIVDMIHRARALRSDIRK